VGAEHLLGAEVVIPGSQDEGATAVVRGLGPGEGNGGCVRAVRGDALDAGGAGDVEFRAVPVKGWNGELAKAAASPEGSCSDSSDGSVERNGQVENSS
jgi:hypothetical protein